MGNLLAPALPLVEREGQMHELPECSKEPSSPITEPSLPVMLLKTEEPGLARWCGGWKLLLPESGNLSLIPESTAETLNPKSGPLTFTLVLGHRFAWTLKHITHTHTFTHIYTNAYTLTHKYTLTHVDTHMHILTHSHTPPVHIHTLMCMHTYTLIHHTHIHAHTYTHTYTHTHTHFHTDTHTNAYTLLSQVKMEHIYKKGN